MAVYLIKGALFFLEIVEEGHHFIIFIGEDG